MKAVGLDKTSIKSESLIAANERTKTTQCCQGLGDRLRMCPRWVGLSALLLRLIALLVWLMIKFPVIADILDCFDDIWVD